MTSNCELFFSHVFVSFGVGSTCLLLVECPAQLCVCVCVCVCLCPKQRSQKLKESKLQSIEEDAKKHVSKDANIFQ
jgi:hypothetical protein